MTSKVRFYDATLTEGPGRDRLLPEQRLQLAQELDQGHVDFIETGMTWLANGHVESLYLVERFRPQHAQRAHQVRLGPSSLGQAQALVEVAARAGTPVLTLQGPLEVPQERREAYRQHWGQAVQRAKAYGRLVIVKFTDFFPMYQREPAWVWDMLATVWQAGSDIITLGDESGRSLPWQVATATHQVRRRYPKTPLGFWMANRHACADDNALSAVAQGATLVHGTLHGYGQEERGYIDLACVSAALWRQHQADLSSQDLEHLWDWSERLHHWLYDPAS